MQERIAELLRELITPEVDRQLLKLISRIEESSLDQNDQLAECRGHAKSIRLHNLLLELGYDSQLFNSPC